MDPIVLFTVIAFMGMTAMLTLAVWRTLKRPPEGEAFDKALETMTTGSELSPTTSALMASSGNGKKWSWNSWWLEGAEQTGREPQTPNSPGKVMGVVTLVMLLFGILVFPGGVAGILVPLVGILAVRLWMMIEQAKRKLAMEKQLPLMLSSLRSNIHAGVTIQVALMKVSEDLPAPLGDEIRRVRDEVNVAVPLEVALQRMSERVGSRLVQFLVSSIGIAIRSGSDIVPQLITIEDIVRQRARIAGKIRSAVALAKPTSYLAIAAPPLMFLYMALTQKGYVEFFLTNGILVGLVGLFLYVSGAIIIQLMVSNVEKI